KEYDSAEKNYKQALEAYEKLIEVEERDKQLWIAVTYHQLGYLAQDLREYEQARDYYQNALEIKIEYGDKYFQASTLHCLGTLAQAEENYSEARNYLQQALEIYVEYKDEYWAGVTREILEDLPE
ncbi:MAG: tetratricopeptide repeat protein, partial [Cyanobacteria bacterium J06639_18]